MWQGQDVFVIGGGPSLKSFNTDRLAGLPTIGCNDAYLLGERVVAFALFGDIGWYNLHKERLAKFTNPKVTCNRRCFGEPDILVLKRDSILVSETVAGKHFHSRIYGLTTDPSRVCWNSNTGATAVNMALLAGAKRVILLGFDMKLSEEGKPNWHPNPLNAGKAERYLVFMKAFNQIAAEQPVKFPEAVILNATPDSAMKCFPAVDIDDILGEEK
jgi:hypothetical protein